jgi:hypothetical protein
MGYVKLEGFMAPARAPAARTLLALDDPANDAMSRTAAGQKPRPVASVKSG